MWHYNGEVFEETPKEYIGFVYMITEKSTNKKYVGKKLFWKPKYTKPRGAKRRIKTMVPSDWHEYFGSSKQLQENVAENGGDKYHREILYLCKTKGAMSYLEMKEQIDRNVLFSADYFNEFIGGKIHSRHVKELNEDL